MVFGCVSSTETGLTSFTGVVLAVSSSFRFCRTWKRKKEPVFDFTLIDLTTYILYLKLFSC